MFLTKIPSNELIVDWYLGEGQDLQDFVVNHLKEEIPWSTGIGIIEAVQHVIQEATYNGNIK